MDKLTHTRVLVWDIVFILEITQINNSNNNKICWLLLDKKCLNVGTWQTSTLYL